MAGHAPPTTSKVGLPCCTTVYSLHVRTGACGTGEVHTGEVVESMSCERRAIAGFRGGGSIPKGQACTPAAHPPCLPPQAVAARAAAGITFMLPTEDAVWCGQELTRRFGLKYWQFALTATDANRFSIRLARWVWAESAGDGAAGRRGRAGAGAHRQDAAAPRPCLPTSPPAAAYREPAPPTPGSGSPRHSRVRVLCVYCKHHSNLCVTFPSRPRPAGTSPGAPRSSSSTTATTAAWKRPSSPCGVRAVADGWPGGVGAGGAAMWAGCMGCGRGTVGCGLGPQGPGLHGCASPLPQPACLPACPAQGRRHPRPAGRQPGPSGGPQGDRQGAAGRVPAGRVCVCARVCVCVRARARAPPWLGHTGLLPVLAGASSFALPHPLVGELSGVGCPSCLPLLPHLVWPPPCLPSLATRIGI